MCVYVCVCVCVFRRGSLHHTHGAARGVDCPGYSVLTVVHNVRLHHALKKMERCLFSLKAATTIPLKYQKPPVRPQIKLSLA